jgi:hypothetical protein
MLALQTNPASPAVLCVEYQQKSLLFDSRGGLPIAKSYASRSTDFSSPLQSLQALETRVYVSLVGNGSLTHYIVTQSRPKRTGFLPNFLMTND